MCCDRIRLNLAIATSTPGTWPVGRLEPGWVKTGFPFPFFRSSLNAEPGAPLQTAPTVVAPSFRCACAILIENCWPLLGPSFDIRRRRFLLLRGYCAGLSDVMGSGDPGASQGGYSLAQRDIQSVFFISSRAAFFFVVCMCVCLCESKCVCLVCMCACVL